MAIIWFDVCALFLTATILYTYAIRRSLRSYQNIVYLCLVISVALTTMGGLGSAIAQNQVAAGVESFLAGRFYLHFFSYLYMASHILTPVIFLFYVYAILGVSNIKKGTYLKVFAPVAIALGVLLSTPLTRGIFYYDENNLYCRGSLMWVFYAAALYYLIYSYTVILVFREGIRKDFLVALYSFAGLSVLGVIIQFFRPVFRIENFFNALVLLMLYISIERPADYVDSQTDLQNEYSFFIRVGTAFRRKTPFRLLLVTLDNLDDLDKAFGGRNVDLLLLEAARFLEELAGSVLAYRLDRSTVCLWLKEGKEQDTEEIRRRIRERFAHPFVAGSYNMYFFECCCEIVCPKDADSSEKLRELIRLAENPQYHRSRHIFRINEEDMAEGEMNREIGRLLGTAVLEKRFFVEYQPVYRSLDGSFSEVRFRVAMQTEHYGKVYPKQTMSIAEKNGTATEIYHYLFNAFCEYIRESRAKERGIRGFFFEIPATVLMAGDGPDWLAETAERYEIPFDMIIFELNEKVQMAYEGILESNILLLHEAGFRFCLINYGSGYTDAQKVLRMPLSSVSLDPALTDKALSNSQADTILRSAVDMLRRFKVEIMLDSLSTKELLAYARELGCDLLLGDSLAAPMSEGGFIEFLKGGLNAV